MFNYIKIGIIIVKVGIIMHNYIDLGLNFI